MHSGKGMAQPDNTYDLFLNFEKYYQEGDITNARKSIETILDIEGSERSEYLVYAYFNLGALNTMAGRYNEAILNYNKAESLVTGGTEKELLKLTGIYNNKARVFNIQRNYSLSIEYLEKSIRLYQQNDTREKQLLINLSAAYQNLGISYFGTKEYETALKHFEKSAELKISYNLGNLAISYLNIGKTYAKTGNTNLAEKYFLRSVGKFTSESGNNFYRLADVYSEYGDFLKSVEKTDESLYYFEKTLDICQKNYGSKHPLLSRAYKKIGEHYSSVSEYQHSLTYLQKAIMTIVNGFDDPDIYVNPPLDSAMLDVELLSILQQKTSAFELWALEQNNSQKGEIIMQHGLECAELALQLISKIQNENLAGKERLQLVGSEKESYFTASRLARNLYKMTDDPGYIKKMYEYARQSKAGILRNSILEGEIFNELDIPAPLKKSYKEHLSDLAVYNHMIHEEIKKLEPDGEKIEVWKDAVFHMNRERESLEDEIHRLFPEYAMLLKKTEPISLDEIQQNLRRHETMIEYFISGNQESAGREIYIFIVNHDRLDYHYTFSNLSFEEGLGLIKNHTRPATGNVNSAHIMSAYINALHNMYTNLLKPVENMLKSDKLIIIPDEEIAYLPFDAFIRSKPDPGQFHFENLDYLIRHFAISYGYSSSLIFNSAASSFRVPEVFAFAPTYSVHTGDFEALKGADREIKSLLNYFQGNKFTGKLATESNFIKNSSHKGIFHLAMHSHIDTLDSRYSCLLFNTENDSVEDGRLNHYEISLLRMQSPMVVLSACNTGTGNLFYGEGIISLARAFILAGASSVVKTFWEINDEISSGIIISYYRYLAMGKEKDEALRMAKLDYLKNSHPAFAAPYYWAGYQIIGNKEALKTKSRYPYLAVLTALIFTTGVVWFYRRRRKSLLARS